MSNEERIIQEMYASSIERTIKRLWITVILLIILLVGSNIAWIIYESQSPTYCFLGLGLNSINMIL